MGFVFSVKTIEEAAVIHIAPFSIGIGHFQAGLTKGSLVEADLNLATWIAVLAGIIHQNGHQFKEGFLLRLDLDTWLNVHFKFLAIFDESRFEILCRILRNP